MLKYNHPRIHVNKETRHLHWYIKMPNVTATNADSHSKLSWKIRYHEGQCNGNMIFQKLTTLVKFLNKTKYNLPSVYSAVAFLENSVSIKNMQKILCV